MDILTSIMTTIISAIIALLVGTLFGGWLQKSLYRLRLVIEPVNSLVAKNKFHKYVTEVVSNKGRVAANDCIGFITIDNLNTNSLLSPNEISANESLPIGITPGEDFKPPQQILTGKGFSGSIDRDTLSWRKLIILHLQSIPGQRIIWIYLTQSSMKKLGNGI